MMEKMQHVAREGNVAVQLACGEGACCRLDDILRDVATVAVGGDLTNSVVSHAHGSGHIVLTTKHTTINHDDNVAREGNTLVKRLVLLGGSGMQLLMEKMQGTSPL